MHSESENNDTGHGYLPAGFETDNFSQPPLYRQIWKADRASRGKKYTWSFIGFIHYFANYLLLNE